MANNEALFMHDDGTIRPCDNGPDHMRVTAHMYENTHFPSNSFGMPKHACRCHAAVLDDAHCVEITRRGERVLFINTTPVKTPCSLCGEESGDRSVCAWCERHRKIDTFAVTREIMEVKAQAEGELRNIMPRDLRTLPVLTISADALPPQQFVGSPRC